MEIKVKNNQSVVDIAIQETGTVEGLWDILKLNTRTDLEMDQGTILKIPKAIQPRVVNFFRNDEVKPLLPATMGVMLNQAAAVIVKAKNSSGEVIATKTVTSTDNVIAIPNTVITLNGMEFLESASGGASGDIELVDQSGSEVYPVNISSNRIMVWASSTAQLMETGQHVTYRFGDNGYFPEGRSFFGLSEKNPFGHYYRFCGTKGGYTDGVKYYTIAGVETTKELAFPELIVLDFSTVDRKGNFLAYHSTPQSYGYISWPNAVDMSLKFTPKPLPKGWRLANRNEVANLFYQPTDLLAFKPFEIPAGTGFIWFSTSRYDGYFYRIQPGNLISVIAPEASNTSYPLPVRVCNLSEYKPK